MVRQAVRYRGLCAIGLVLALVVSSSAVADFAAYSDGHGDIGVAYAGMNALELHWHVDDGAVIDGVTVTESEFEPDGIRAIVPTFSSFARGASDATWGFIGNSAGATTYYLPEVDTPGLPFLGFGSEELNPMDWTSTNLNWTMSLLSAPVGGHFSMFNDLGSPTVALSTFNGDLNFTTTLGGHSHFNFAFTQPGVYDVEFFVSGTHGVDGLATDTQTFRFDVAPAAVPEPTSIAGALALAGGWVVSYRRRKK